MTMLKRSIFTLMPSLAFLTFRGKGSGGGDSISTQKLDPQVLQQMLLPMYGATERAAGVIPITDKDGNVTYQYDDYEGYDGQRLTGPNDFYSYLTDPTKLDQTLAWGNDPFQESLANATNLASYGGPDDIVSTDADYLSIVGADRIGGRQIGRQADATYSDAVASQAAKARDSFYRDASVTGVGTGPASLYKDAIAASVDAPRDAASQDVTATWMGPAGDVNSDMINAAQMGPIADIANQNINAAQMGSIADIANQNINAAQIDRNAIRNVSGTGVTGANVAADAFGSLQPQARGSVRDVFGSGFMGGNLDQYMNPYRSQVIDTTMEALDRQRQIQQQQNAASATQAGAFGGSRQGVLEAETNRGFADQAAQTIAALNTQGFDTAANLQQADADRALQAQLANQGMDQASTQQALDLSGQFGLANQEANLRAGLANQGVDSSTLQFNAGNQQQSSMQNAANALAAAQANQQTAFNQRSFDADNRQQSSMQNAANALAAAQSNQQMGFNQGSFNAGNQQQANMQNAANSLSAGLANQQMRYNTGLFNADQWGQANALNAANQLQTSLANQGADLSRGSLDAQLANAAAMQNANQQLIASGNNQRTNFDERSLNSQMLNNAALQNANMRFNASANNQQSDNARNLANAQLGNAAALQNANMGFNANAYNQSNNLQRMLANQSTIMDARKSNQATYLDQAKANQAAALEASIFNAGGRNAASMRNAELDIMSQQQALSGNQQLLNNVGFGRDALFQNLDTRLGAGDMVDAKSKEKLDLDYQNWIDEQNYPAQQAGMLQSAFGMVPQLTSTKTVGDKKPDLWQNLADTFSDVRLKDNITKLNGYAYNFKSRPEVTTGGVMAQEVELIAPHLVNTDVETGYKRVNYEALVGVLLEAVKDLKSEVEGLKRG